MKLGMQVGLVPGHIVLDGDPAPPPPKGHSPTQFSVHICWLHGSRCHLVWSQASAEATLCQMEIPLYHPRKRGQSPLPNFWPIYAVAKRLHASRCHLVWRQASCSPRDFVLDGNPLNFRHMFIIATVISLEHCTMHSRYWFIQVQVLYYMHSFFQKSLIVFMQSVPIKYAMHIYTSQRRQWKQES